MKRHIILITIIGLLLLVLPLIGNAEIVDSGTCGANLTWTLDDQGTLIISGTGDMTGHPWGDEINTVIINEGVTSVANKAFYVCRYLKNVTLPNSLITIGDYAFDECFSLRTITLPENVKSIGRSAFYGCPLTSINLPSGITSIKDYTFADCTKLTSINIPNGVTYIGEDAFALCYELSGIEIPDSVTSIGDSAFWACKNLKTVALPSGLTSLGGGAFHSCYKLESINIPSGVTEIQGHLFFECSNLKTLTLPYVTSWSDRAFQGCTSLQSITLPSCDDSLIQWFKDNGYGDALHILPHNIVKVERTEPTIDTEGAEAHWKCSVCGQLFSDANGIQAIDAPIAIPKIDKVLAFVTRCYRLILGREPDAGGLAYWVENLKSGKEKASQIINGFVTSNEFVSRQYNDETAVVILYKAMLGREPDAGGKNYWMSVLNGGNPLAVVINGFCTSNEFTALCASYGIQPGSVETGPEKPPKPVKDMTLIRAFVTRCYQVILGRSPDNTGLEYWAKALANGEKEAAEIIDGFVNSNEYRAKNLNHEDSVETLYMAMLGRGSDAGGKAYWVQQLQGGKPFAVIINGFCTSNEFKALCNQYGITPGSVKGVETVAGAVDINPNAGAVTVRRVNEEKLRAYIVRSYTVLLEREPSEDEIVYWAGSVLADKMTVAKALHDIVLSNEFAAKRPDNAELVRRLYQVYTGRTPGEGEADTWIARLDAGEPLENIVNGFAASKEFRNVVDSMTE